MTKKDFALIADVIAGSPLDANNKTTIAVDIAVRSKTRPRGKRSDVGASGIIEPEEHSETVVTLFPNRLGQRAQPASNRVA